MKVVINDSSAPELPSANDAVLLLSDVADYSLDIHLSENAFEPGPGSTPLSFGAEISTSRSRSPRQNGVKDGPYSRPMNTDLYSV
jgi:hypothetical protein